MLESALCVQDSNIVQILLNAGSDSNPFVGYAGTPLQILSTFGNCKLVLILLDKGIDINAAAHNPSGGTALQAAADNDHSEIVQFLQDKGAAVNATAANNAGRTVLQAAAGYGDIELVSILSVWGDDINARASSDGGQTASQAAAGIGNIELVRILNDAGADINCLAAKDDGVMVMQVAVETGSIDLVQYLLDKNIGITDRVSLGSMLYSALIHHKCSLKKVETLLNAGADVNATTRFGSALCLAVHSGNASLVQCLMDEGVDLDGDGFGTLIQRSIQTLI